MMKPLASLLAGLLLAACGGNVRIGDPVRYDFGRLEDAPAELSLPLAAVDVRAAPWLAGPAMHFRLAYAEPQRRQTYAESRWAAPPAELLAALLARRLLAVQSAPATGCRLQLVVDELEQRFDDPRQSLAVLEAQAQLTPPRGAEIVARRAFRVQRPAATADARGGAAATREAARALATELAGWLEETSRATPAVVERCRR
jgi:cholesterol transport system auxiliary component